MADGQQEREPTLREILAAVLATNRKVEHMSEALAGLEASVTALEAEDATLVEAVGEVVGEIGTLEVEIASLKSAEAITPAELEPLEARIGAVSEKLSSAVTAIQGALPKAPVPPVTAAPQAVYLYHGEAALDTAEWTEAPYVTAGEQPGRTLYYFSGDTPGTEPPTANGVGHEGIELYSGELTAK